MAERLTDKGLLTTAAANGDLIHVVDISDTTSHASGTSKAQTAKNLLSKGLTVIQSCILVARTSSSTSTTALSSGDVVIYVDGNEFLMATIQDTITTVPDDLRDVAKAKLWFDGSPLL